MIANPPRDRAGRTLRSAGRTPWPETPLTPEQWALVEAHYHLAGHLGRRWAIKFCQPRMREEFEVEVLAQLVQAAKSWDASRVVHDVPMFKAYLRWHIRRAYRRCGELACRTLPASRPEDWSLVRSSSCARQPSALAAEAELIELMMAKARPEKRQWVHDVVLGGVPASEVARREHVNPKTVYKAVRDTMAVLRPMVS